MDEPLISVVVPVYKVEEYLDRCLSSVVNQTHKNLEIIIIDDGSPDACPKKCDEWGLKDRRIKVIHKKNSGLSSARNAGIEAATGRYIGFVDSDDWIEPDMYEHLLKNLIETESDISICQYARNKEGLDTSQASADTAVLTENAIWEYFYRIHGEPSNYGVWCRLYKKTVLDGVRFVEGRINEDVLFTYDVYKNAKKLVISSSRKYLYFDNPNGITRKKLSAKDVDLFEMWDIICQKEGGGSISITGQDLTGRGRLLLSTQNACFTAEMIPFQGEP